MLKIVQGGWVPLAIALGIFILMTTWQRGRIIVRSLLVDASIPRIRAREDGAAGRLGQAERRSRAGQGGDENEGRDDAGGAHLACIGATAVAP